MSQFGPLNTRLEADLAAARSAGSADALARVDLEDAVRWVNDRPAGEYVLGIVWQTAVESVWVYLSACHIQCRRSRSMDAVRQVPQREVQDDKSLRAT